MKKIILLALSMTLVQLCFTQGYNNAFGIRLGTEWGMTYKQRILRTTTLEGLLQYSSKRRETTLTLLGAQHFPLIFRNFNVYGGGGLHKGWVGSNAEADYKDPFGLTLIGGAEVSIARFNISYDLKPSINVVGGENTVYMHTGISVRYIIEKRPLRKTESEKAQKQRQKERRKKRKKKKRAKRKGGETSKINWKFWEKKD